MLELSIIKENLVSQIWGRQLIKKQVLNTAEGEKVRVLFPGRESKDSGPDFRDAIISIGGRKPSRGDVEVHVRSREWRGHGHHKDPEYNGVVLHVVMWDDGKGASVLQNGEKVPVLAMHPYLTRSVEELLCRVESPSDAADPCQDVLDRHGRAVLDDILKGVGVERFKLKSAEFLQRLEAGEPGEVLYTGIMRGLGYAKNKWPFEELACRVPLRMLMESAAGGEVLEIQALMLGSAGLLPSQRCNSSMVGDALSCCGAEAEDLQRRWSAHGIKETMKPGAWRFFRVRPENFPTRRIVAASHLVSRYRDGFLPRMVGAAGGSPVDRVQKDLEESFIVCVTGYWANHYDFGIRARGSPSLVGRGRAREIVVNVVLPFLSAWGEKLYLPWLKERALHLYQNHPRLGENWISRYMRKKIFGEDKGDMVSACQQQGLIHIHKAYCVERHCCDCPLG